MVWCGTVTVALSPVWTILVAKAVSLPDVGLEPRGNANIHRFLTDRPRPPRDQASHCADGGTNAGICYVRPRWSSRHSLPLVRPPRPTTPPGSPRTEAHKRGFFPRKLPDSDFPLRAEFRN